MSTRTNKTEQFNIQFLGMKFNSTNPGKTTIIILIMLLVFFLALVVLLKAYILPAMATIGGTKAIGLVATKTSILKRWIWGRSP